MLPIRAASMQLPSVLRVRQNELIAARYAVRPASTVVRQPVCGLVLGATDRVVARCTAVARCTVSVCCPETLRDSARQNRRHPLTLSVIGGLVSHRVSQILDVGRQ